MVPRINLGELTEHVLHTNELAPLPYGIAKSWFAGTSLNSLSLSS